ncbi:hypothetical protein BKA69DRAFT_1064954 [Paraphysoderma sedebokerense]|nr:hypothetical protein BKA69DRAFT_1064954 [Paraphysoderma sedebokerense]
MYTLAEKKLQSKLTNNRKRNRDEFDDSGLTHSNPKTGHSKAKNSSRQVDESSDDEESKTRSITKKVGSVNSAKQSFDRHDPTNSNTTKAIPSPASSLPNAASNSNLPGAVTLATVEAQDAKLQSDISITNGNDSQKGVKSVANRTVSTATDVLNHYLNSRSNGSEKKKRKKKKNKNKNKNDSSATETQLAD